MFIFKEEEGIAAAESFVAAAAAALIPLPLPLPLS